MTRHSTGMTERQLQDAIRDLCRRLGLLCYHTHDSRRSEAGFPDLVIVGRRVLLRELKTDVGRASKPQLSWLLALEAAGADAKVWRPADLHNGAIVAELQALRTRGLTTAEVPDATS